MDVSIIIVNYNTFTLTKACIQSIYDKTHLTQFEIILVDNASIECDPHDFLKLFPEIILIKNSTNLGFGRANNAGMSIAKGKYLLLLNSDTYLVNDALDIAFRFAEIECQRHYVYGANILNQDLSKQSDHYPFVPISYKETLRHAIIMDNIFLRKIYDLLLYKPEQSNSVEKIGGLYGAYIFLHRKVFEETGGFDPDFFMYCEETEWFRNRINKAYSISICKEAMIVHIGGGSTGTSIVKKNNVLSGYLYWYKLGYSHFFIHTLFSYFNILPNLVALLLLRPLERKRHLTLMKYRISCLKKVILDIPRFSNKFASRINPLSFNIQ